MDEVVKNRFEEYPEKVRLRLEESSSTPVGLLFSQSANAFAPAVRISFQHA